MKKNSFFRYVVKGKPILKMLLVFICVVAILVVNELTDMKEATTNYEYCVCLCNLVWIVSMCYFIFIFILMTYLNYIHKQYSKWTIRLFYVLGVSSLVYFVVAGHVYDYVVNHVESDYMIQKLPSLARTVFTGPVYWIIIGYFFIPKILKDAQKMKEEQDLTI